MQHSFSYRYQDANRQFAEAVERQSVVKMRAAVAAGADVNARDSNGMTLLQNAVCAGLTTSVIFLATNGADPDLTSYPAGYNAMHYAVYANQPHLIPTLAAVGGKLNGRDVKGDMAPVHLAAYLGRFDAAEMLAKCGADMTARNAAGQTPAQVARARIDELEDWTAKAAFMPISRFLRDIVNAKKSGSRLTDAFVDAVSTKAEVATRVVSPIPTRATPKVLTTH